MSQNTETPPVWWIPFKLVMTAIISGPFFLFGSMGAELMYLVGIYLFFKCIFTKWNGNPPSGGGGGGGSRIKPLRRAAAFGAGYYAGKKTEL